MYQVTSIENFRRELKRLAKKHRSLLNDVDELISQLEENPQIGRKIKGNCYKILLKIGSKKTGKDGGGRVVTCVQIVEQTVHLLTIYDKSEKSDLEHGELDALLAQI